MTSNRGFVNPALESQKIIESKLNSGMITQIDSGDIPTTAVQLAKNAICRFDKLGRRPGSVLLTPLKPNALPVTRIAFIKSADGSPYTLRMTPSSIHIRNESSWSSISIVPPLTGALTDRFVTADILNKFVFANNGADPIQVVNFSTNICSPLGNARDVYAANPRFLFGFFNRVVGLALKDLSEVTAIWSADGVSDEFDPSVNQTAGSSPILESPADLSDFITGGIAFTNVAVMFREKSIWLITKQPIPTDPFYFFSTVPGIGCDCSNSIQLVGNGVVWCDTKKKEIYAYVPGATPEKLSNQIKDTLFRDITDPASVFSAYNSGPGEYNIYIPIGGNVTRAYTYNFDNKSWTVQELYGVTDAENVTIASRGLTIDELVGSIDNLAGSIDSLSQASAASIPFSYGRDDGSIAVEDNNSNIDAAHIDFPIGVPYVTDIISKKFELPELNLYLSKVNIKYIASQTTTLTFQYSRDDGLTWITGKVLVVSSFNLPTTLSFRKIIKATQITWRVTYNSSDLALLGYEVYVYPSGDTRTNQ